MSRAIRDRALMILAILAVIIPVGGFTAPASAAPLVCELTHSCPIITGATPDFGPTATVTITGTNLSKVTSVLFGATPANFQYEGPLTLNGAGYLLAEPPTGQAGSTVPVSGLAGTVPVPSKASYSYPLAVLDVTGPIAHCADDGEEDVQYGDWGYNQTNGSGSNHTMDFSGVSGSGGTLAFAISAPVFHINTEFDDDSGEYPFDENVVHTRDCFGGQVVVGDGATYSATLELCEVVPTTTTTAAPAATTTSPFSAAGPPAGPCTNYDGVQGTWAPLPFASDQLTDREQLQPGQSSLKLGDLALPTAGAAALDLDNAALTLRVVATEQETDLGALPVAVVFRHALGVSEPFNIVLSPVAAVQASAVPYTIIYAPPGDQSSQTFSSGVGFGTDYTISDSNQQSNSETNDQSVEDKITASVDGKDIDDALAGLGFKFSDSAKWDDTTKTSFGATDDLADEASDTAAFGLSRTTSPDWNDWPGDGTTCTPLAKPAADGGLYDCSPAGLQHNVSAFALYNHAAFWDDVFELELHPQYAVFSIGHGTAQYVMLGADPGLGERTVRELYDCEEGIEVAGVDQCLVAYASTNLVDANGHGVSYSSTSQYATLTPSDAMHLLALDPFYMAGSQNAKIPTARGEIIGNPHFGAYASGAVADESGSSEQPNTANATYTNTQAKKSTAAATTTSSVDITDTFGATVSGGVTYAGAGETLTYGDKNSTGTTVTVTYKDSTAVSSSLVTTSTATLSDVDPTTPGAKCPAPSPVGPACHGPLKDESQAVVYLDRRFGSFMFVDPNAPPAPRSLALENERSVAAQSTVDDAEGQAEQSSGFSDVPPHSAAGFAIGTLTRLGVMSGYGRLFRPNAVFTPAELAATLGRSVRLNPDRALQVLTGSATNPSRALTETAFAHAISVALGVMPSRARAFVGGAFGHHFVAGGVVTRADAAIALLPALTSRCLTSCHLGS